MKINIKNLPTIAALTMLLLTFGAVTAAASEAVGNAEDYLPYPFEFGDYDEKLIISGSSWDYDEWSGITDDDIIRIKAEENYDLQRYIDTTEERHDLALIMLRYAEWNHMDSYLEAYNHGEVESDLADKAERHIKEIVSDSSSSDINEAIFGTSDVPLRIEDDYVLVLDKENDRMIFIITNETGLFTSEPCLDAFDIADDFARENGYWFGKDTSYAGGIWINANRIGNLGNVEEIDEDYIDLKELDMKIYPIED